MPPAPTMPVLPRRCRAEWLPKLLAAGAYRDVAAEWFARTAAGTAADHEIDRLYQDTGDPGA